MPYLLAIGGLLSTGLCVAAACMGDLFFTLVYGLIAAVYAATALYYRK